MKGLNMAQAEIQPEVEVDNASAIEEVTESTEESKPEEPQGSVPLSAHTKLRSRAQAAEDRAVEAERKLEAATKEKDLALMAIGSPADEAELLPPNPEDYFDDHGGYVSAFQAYNKQNSDRLTEQVQKTTAKAIADNNQSTQQARQQDDEALKYKAALNAHHERADKLKASDYLDREDRVIGNIGHELFGRLIKNYPNSEEVIYALGDDTQEATDRTRELLQQFEVDPWMGVTKLNDYAASIGKTETGNHLPAPDTPLEGGGVGGLSSADKELVKLRQAVLGGKDKEAMNKLVAFKRANKIE